MLAIQRANRSLFELRLLGGLLLIALGSTARAERALQVLVDHDGRRTLESEVFGVSDRYDVDEAARLAWRSLDEMDLRPVVALAPDPGGAQGKELAGRVRISVVWLGDPSNPLATADVDRLRLVRTPGRGDRWRLPRDEIKRTAAAAGLLIDGSWWPAVVSALAACALLGVAVWAWLRRSRRGNSSASRAAA